MQLDQKRVSAHQDQCSYSNLRHNKRLNRFTLRGKDNIGTQ